MLHLCDLIVLMGQPHSSVFSLEGGGDFCQCLCISFDTLFFSVELRIDLVVSFILSPFVLPRIPLCFEGGKGPSYFFSPPSLVRQL